MKILAFLLLLLLPMSMHADDGNRADEALSCLERGNCCMADFDLLHAMEWYERSLQLHATDEALRRLADCHYQRGDYRQALLALSSISDDSLRHADMRLKYYCFARQKQMDSLFVWGGRIIEAFPLDAEVVANVASKYNEAGHSEQALKLTMQYHQLDSANVYVERQMGYAQYLCGQYAEAISTYERLAERGDSSVIVLFPLGMCYYMSHDRPNAYRVLRHAASATGYANATCLAKLGIVATQMGHDDEGVGYLQQAAKLFLPDDEVMALIFETMGDACLRMGNMQAGVDAYLQCLAHHPDKLYYVYYELAQGYGALKDAANERKYYRLFLSETAKLKSTEGLEEAMAFARAKAK